MSEAAEVKLATDFLNETLENKIIIDWRFTRDGQYEEHDPKGYDEFCDNLPMLIEGVFCKGKIIYFVCFNEFKQFYILHNMRSTGVWTKYPDEDTRWYIECEGKNRVWFSDLKCLGTLHFTSNEMTINNVLNKLGPDILSKEFTLEVWRKLVHTHKNLNVTSFLMNQSIISGCGNYTKCEVLYYAKISPCRKVESLTEKESEKLYEGLRIIPRIVYISEYYEYKIYCQKDAKITRTKDGRNTFWDPEIQK